MKEDKDTAPAEKDGKYEFDIHYSGRELHCKVEKEQNKLSVQIDNNINAELTVQEDGCLIQTGGSDLPDSAIDYIKKRILG
ncbi:MULTISPECIES: hypothetical protein [unclassified Mucilaginibacter]|uniref:hypothetical protein n=1 Tax=unclassified Mucilaginibacter TaxID=2617802 RepID=UPI00095A4428|nr:MULTISPECIES: hypothetical protein [unclassified Mucilaginibacter]OJW16418.1 MAG: hypothetical protein BGO48_09570 [Mucilaginibacter sp. 44-25]PAW92157.1 hypothetical protein CKK33_01055 [Mucilaginibacter sp. MD40]PLW91009.1 MAG: hypothetical protein C0154_03450 [Mucilaginibacter sp.]HEK21685.1 hypothetical protein [Bacteroidota bacterium]